MCLMSNVYVVPLIYSEGSDIDDILSHSRHCVSPTHARCHTHFHLTRNESGNPDGLMGIGLRISMGVAQDGSGTFVGRARVYLAVRGF